MVPFETFISGPKKLFCTPFFLMTFSDVKMMNCSRDVDNSCIVGKFHGSFGTSTRLIMAKTQIQCHFCASFHCFYLVEMVHYSAVANVCYIAAAVCW